MIRKESYYSMISVGFKLLSGPISILLITTSLSELEQGIYFMFLSLSSVQWVFELGITTCMVQYISSSTNKADRLKYTNFLFYFMISSSLLLFVFLYLSSFYIFDDVAYELWFEPWFFYLILVALNLWANFILVVEEGSGDIEHAYMTKMLSAIAYSTTLMSSLYLGGALYSLFFAQLSMFIVVIYRSFNRINYKNISGFFSCFSSLKATFFKVMPFQYKLSIVWITGYLYWNSFQLILFKYESPELSGYFGATNGVFGALAMMAISLVSTQRARWGRINEIEGGKKTYPYFLREAFKGSVIYIVMSLIFIVSFALFPYPSLKNRFLPLSLMALLFVFRYFVLFQEFILIYLRTFKDEPLYKITVVNYMLLPCGIFLGVFLGDVKLVLIISIFFQFLFSLIYYGKMNKYLLRRGFLD